MHAGKALISFPSRVPVAIKRSPRRWGRRNPPIGAVPKISGGNEPSKENSSLQSLTSRAPPFRRSFHSQQGGEREPGGAEPEDVRDEPVLAQDWLLRGGQAAPEEEEEEEDRPQHDRGAYELHAPDTHRLRGDDGGPAPVRVGPRTDEVERTQCQRQEQSVIAGPWTNPRSPFDLLANPDTLCP
ncbi:hypothetical protein AGOR_G00043550 [Albula goreensis]|uniref:Uncharacterized protein n=1 Tax=Albula goreensis TaxID=1534307 RepID=A0A8T3E0X6_9TELE|nr:hypothetical protein AGOR_G00043550 [Albula goreensis]